MLGGNIDSLDSDLAAFGIGRQDLALLAFVLSGQNDNFIIFLYLYSV